VERLANQLIIECDNLTYLLVDFASDSSTESTFAFLTGMRNFPGCSSFSKLLTLQEKYEAGNLIPVIYSFK